MNGIPWTEPELELLESIAGCFPRHEITVIYNKRATRQGLPQRSENAVLVKLKRLGQSQKTIEDNWRMSTLADLLEIHRDRVRTWVHGRFENGTRIGGKLPARKVSNMTLIRKVDFQGFAARYPEKLKGIHPSNLLFVLEDKELVYKIIQLGKPETGRKHRLIRVETGEIFESGRQAAKAVRGDSKHIVKCAKAGKKAYGMEFRIIEIQGVTDYSHLAIDFMPEKLIRERIIQMADQGMTKAEIAFKLGVPVSKVKYIISRYSKEYAS